MEKVNKEGCKKDEYEQEETKWLGFQQDTHGAIINTFC